jgi:hypothetical protein
VTLHCEFAGENIEPVCINCGHSFIDFGTHQIVARVEGEWLGVLCRPCLGELHGPLAVEWLYEIERRFAAKGRA